MFETGEFSSSARLVAWLVVWSAAAISAIWDVRTGRIPNKLTLPLLFGGLVASTLLGGPRGLVAGIGNAFLMSLPCLILFLFAGGGAGDVKLMAALGAWLSYHDAVIALICVSIAGIACGLGMALLQGRTRILFSNLSRILGVFAFAVASRKVNDAETMMPTPSMMQRMPFGVAIALGFSAAGAGLWWFQW
jgi:prepilin peptidase CpaA